MSAYHENALQPGFELAEYRIDAVLGHGGFGITYLARDKTLGAEVAIKEYLPHDMAVRDPKSGSVMPALSKDAIRNYQWGLKQFVKEARALARFKHPNIVRVLRFIEAHGTAYMVMEYEQGQTLAQHLKRAQGHRLDEPSLLRIVMPILNGLHAMHEAGLLHLDIKPENIYLREDGSPILIDFGSARQAMSSVAASARIALTHGYAPIEQYPDKGQLGPWSDIYALGATMYRCVTGKRPEDSVDRYRAVLDYEVDPVKPAVKSAQKRYQPLLLEAIDRAMQIHAKDRPQTAREFQDGLMGKHRGPAERTDRRTDTAVPSARVRTRIQRQLEPVMSPGRAVAVALFIATALGIMLGFWMGWIPNPLVSSTEPTTPSVPRTAQPKPRPVAGPAERTRRESTAVAVKDVRKRSIPAPNTLSKTLTGHTDWVQSVSFSPDGKQLASAGNDGAIRIWDVASGQAVGALSGHRHPINALAYSPDGKWLASVSTNGSVRVWDRANGNTSRMLRAEGYAVYALAFAPNGQLATAGKDRAVTLWNITNGKVVRTLEGHKSDIHALALSPSGRSLVSAGADRTLRVWDLVRGEEAAELPGHRETILALAYSPDGRWLASSDASNTIRIWDAHTLAPVRALTDVHHAALSLVFSRDGSWLAAGAADHAIHVFDTDIGRPLQVLSGHLGYVQALALSPTGGVLASGGRDNNVRLWQAK